jgi:hypothetical protein
VCVYVCVFFLGGMGDAFKQLENGIITHS